MSDEWNGVSMAQEDFEEPAGSPTTPSPDLTRSQVGRSGTPVRLITWLSGLALVTLGCAPDESPTQPGGAEEPGAGAPALTVVANSWTTVSPGMDVSRIVAGTAPNAAGQELVYTFGGFDGFDGSLNRIGTYNPATDTWTYRDSPRFETGRFWANGVAKLGSKLYFSGGYNSIDVFPISTRTLWAYDYGHNLITRKADMPIYSAEGVSGVINGKLYVLPGVCGSDNYPQPGYCADPRTRRFFRYDPATNTWISRAQVPHFHRRGVAGVINGKFYVAGGFVDEFQPSADLDVYDPTTNTWRTLAPLPAAGGGLGAVIHAGLFVVSGSHSYFYNPATNKWTIKAAPKTFHAALARAAVAGKSYLFATGGSHSGQFDEELSNGTEKYTP
jgi:N-acetylneuraminic acid mutarotase